MKLPQILLIVLAGASVLGCKHESARPILNRQEAEKVQSIIATVAIVSIFRVDEKAGTTNKPNMDGHRILSGPIPLSAAARQKLQRLVAQRSLFLETYVKACPFFPGVAFRYEQSGEVVDQLVCFSCQDLLTLYGKGYRMEDFNEARPELVSLVKEILPEDKIIQAIEERPEGYEPRTARMQPEQISTPTWPAKNYAKVIGYAFDNPKPEGFSLLREAGLDVAQLKSLTTKSVTLDEVSVSALLNATFGRTPQIRPSACYDPHHIFVFYDAAGKPCAAIEICLTCHGVSSWPSMDIGFHHDFGSLARLCSGLELGLGSSDTLDQYLEILNQ